jgi:cation diffusion facilitator CzcD-associated flavoprotein CzcO
MSRDEPAAEHVDVLIVGAGISGVDAAYRLKTRCPDRSWLILEARDRIGGTWDLFRYPGVRSDSDMFTLGFPFRPWPSDQAIAGGEAIRQYVEDTAREFGIFERIRFGHRVTRASWSSADERWSVETDRGRFTCSFLFGCCGYYDYDAGYRPEWEGESAFRGRVVHPQFWPDDMDISGKTVAVIGSGATAVTLVPALAEKGAHVTMVQRSPSYIVSRPSRDGIARFLQRILPARSADAVVRWKNVLLTSFFYAQARRSPEKFGQWIKDQISKQLPPGYPVERDFSPPYKPWDQRLCLVPDADLFAAMRSGKVSIATGPIERFTPDGLRLQTGEDVKADIVVTATGLVVKILGGIQLDVDGDPVAPTDRLIWKGMMLSGVPNLFFAFGYTNASWTLRSDLTARLACRLLNHMKRHGNAAAVPREPDGGMERRPVIDFSSGYVKRAEGVLPKQGGRHPWNVRQNYLRDLLAMRLSRIDEDLVLEKKLIGISGPTVVAQAEKE